MALCQDHPKYQGELVEHRDCLPCILGRFNLMKDQTLDTDANREEHRLWLELRLNEAWTDIREFEKDIETWESTFVRKLVEALTYWLDGYNDGLDWLGVTLGTAMRDQLQKELDRREALQGHFASLIQGMLTRPMMYAANGGELEVSFLTALQCWCLNSGQKFTNKMARYTRYLKHRGLIPSLRACDQLGNNLEKTAEFLNDFWRVDRWET